MSKAQELINLYEISFKTSTKTSDFAHHPGDNYTLKSLTKGGNLLQAAHPKESGSHIKPGSTVHRVARSLQRHVDTHTKDHGSTKASAVTDHVKKQIVGSAGKAKEAAERAAAGDHLDTAKKAVGAAAVGVGALAAKRAMRKRREKRQARQASRGNNE
jgi:hypothetical protein